MPATNVVPNRAHFIGIFIIALAVLAYQVLLTRLFSVMLYYHYAFAGISLAMLGLTIGAEKVYLNEKRFSQERFTEEWAKAALGFSLSSVAVVLWFLYSPLILPAESVMAILSVSLFLFVIPFTYSGICVTAILTRSASDVGKLYAADLVGAALGCMGIVAVLFIFDPVTIILGLAALSAFAAWFMAHGSSSKLASRSKYWAIIWLFACAMQGGLYLTDNDHLRVIWAKTHKQENILFERWNAFSRVRVVPYGVGRGAFGWGFAHHHSDNIEQNFLDIDADAGTVITRFDGDVKPLAYLADDIINIGYQIRPVKEVVVIGVGGGRDIMSALYFGVKKVTGIELNPAIFEAITKKFADFTGHFYQRPDVKLVNAEARSWLNQKHPKVDLVQISLIDTWAATAAGGLTLSENKLYTVEAWQDFLHTLNPNGMLVVSRWFDPKLHKGEFYRLMSLAAESLKRQGIPASEVRQHILSFNVGQIITVVISPTAFSGAELIHVKQVVKEREFSVMMSPRQAWDKTSEIIASGKADDAFYTSLPLDVTAPTDNRPFFFYMKRLKDIMFGENGIEENVNFKNNSAVGIVLILLAGTFIITAVFVIQPLLQLAKKMPTKGILPHLVYFAAIGLGFMLIEISQMQRLMVFLGHPVYGLSVVLFTLLLFGGVGSFTVHAGGNPGNLPWRALLLLLMLCITGLATPPLTEALKVCGTSVRILTSVVLLAPAGFCMGMMFPVGMILSSHYSAQQPWFWGINGATSVFASVLGVAISLEYGIAAAFWTGVACYVVSMLFAFKNVQEA